MTEPARGARDVDRAALLGAALAAVVALTFGSEGEWDWLATGAGLALLAVLVAFFHLPAGSVPQRAWHAELAAMAAVAGLAATLVVAAPLQAVLAALPVGRTCQASAAVAAGVVMTDDGRRRGAQVAVTELRAEGITTTADESLARAAADEHRSVFGSCIGAATTSYLWIPALGFGVLILGVAEVRLRRARRA